MHRITKHSRSEYLSVQSFHDDGRSLTGSKLYSALMTPLLKTYPDFSRTLVFLFTKLVWPVVLFSFIAYTSCNSGFACGVSRSVTITLAYLMVVTDFSLAELFKAVQGARHCACPNHGFMQQLLDFERSGRVAMLREKLFSRFGEWPAERRKQDTDALTAAIEAQEHFILHGVYPGEEPLDGLTPSAMHAADPEGKATSPDLPAPVGKLKHTVFTVYSNDKPRSLEDFIASRCPPEDVGAKAEDK
ncbi:Dual specificity protein phosphatase 22 [Clonorchis sinensis]|uniref:Dual specificity protein phosphatase 22 n=1 Tax=Clonorchis sinensis TaxID=79923 RepID=A0A3R7G1A7_CLOSI|nr:Dual specificity protein phosphatase 22 [Clonorchis sinensis]